MRFVEAPSFDPKLPVVIFTFGLLAYSSLHQEFSVICFISLSYLYSINETKMNASLMQFALGKICLGDPRPFALLPTPFNIPREDWPWGSLVATPFLRFILCFFEGLPFKQLLEQS